MASVEMNDEPHLAPEAADDTAQSLSAAHDTAQSLSAAHDTAQSLSPAHDTAQSLSAAHDTAQSLSAAHDTAQSLSAAQRARIERNRLQARQRRDARLVQRRTEARAAAAPPDSGGGFLLDDAEPAPPPRARAPPAPILDPAERPCCLDCERRFPQSYLFDTFGYNVCDECRDDDGAHALMTRTEAKSEFLLKDCDLDLRPPALRCVRRRNPHGSRLGDMRLYLRAQVQARAREAWGSLAELAAERARREQARARSKQAGTERRLRALRMDVRSSLFDRTRAAHAHEFGAEQFDADSEQYSRACACGHVETYEKM